MNKIKTYLNSMGIDDSIPFDIQEDSLEKLKPKQIYSQTIFEFAIIRDSFKGNKSELVIRNSIIENTSFNTLQVSGKIIFHNCIFRNIKFSKCNLQKSCFFQCQFIESSVVDTVLKGSYFINCDGVETLDFYNSNLKQNYFIGSQVDKNRLEESSNLIDDITIIDSKYEYRSKVATLPPSKERTKPRDIVENEIFRDQEFSGNELTKHLYHKCTFEGCTFDSGVNLEFTLDFKECVFNETSIVCKDINKVSFDNSIFNNLTLAGNYIHVSFAGCTFQNITIDDSATFVACLFDHSNAYEYFDIFRNHMSNIMIAKEMKGEGQSLIMEKVKELCALMKDNEEEQETIVTQDEILEYVSRLDDVEYIDFITLTSSKRKEERNIV